MTFFIIIHNGFLLHQALDVDSAARAVQQRDQDALLAHLTQAQSADTEVHMRQSMAYIRQSKAHIRQSMAHIRQSQTPR